MNNRLRLKECKAARRVRCDSRSGREFFGFVAQWPIQENDRDRAVRAYLGGGVSKESDCVRAMRELKEWQSGDGESQRRRLRRVGEEGEVAEEMQRCRAAQPEACHKIGVAISNELFEPSPRGQWQPCAWRLPPWRAFYSNRAQRCPLASSHTWASERQERLAPSSWPRSCVSLLLQQQSLLSSILPSSQVAFDA